ncbi:PKD domain-containing protein [Pontibacter sp. G13]|uniref:PKD domain-containing protein n=1 Tax=Pontibacter sp. G13 TaxID=3074898 RepID=UPI0028895484|nr:PKD domain-containing protein [Pontibacter sp. G13]WNJ16591.1 PKD domain-containing protein [Pontibacter sp. G13]
MKRNLYKLLVLLVSGFLGVQSAEASHYMGYDLTYECLGSCTYRIYMTLYYDCAGGATQGGLPAPGGGGIGAPSLSFVGNGANCIAPTAVGGWIQTKWDEVTPICPALFAGPAGTYPTYCKAGTPTTGTQYPNVNVPAGPVAPLPGVAGETFYRDYSFCNVNCDNYEIQGTFFARNGTIASGAANQGMQVQGTTIDLTLSPCNNSPYFTVDPVPYFCAGTNFTFNQGAVDPDGDSLSYELGPCWQGLNNQVTYVNGFSPTSPLGPTWAVSINAYTGDITFTPNPTGAELIAVLCLTVNEWRNGQLIGSVTRDIQVTVIDEDCGSNPATGGAQNITYNTDTVPGNSLSFNEVKVCPGAQICFDIPALVQDSSLEYTMWWNEGIPGATFTDATNPAIMDTIVGDSPVARFCWTPPMSAQGAYFFIVSTRDDQCPIPGFNQTTYIVYVEDALQQSNALATFINCNDMELSVDPVSTIPSIYNNVFPVINWSGNGNLQYNQSLSDSAFIHTYPEPGTYFFNVELEDTFGCSINLTGLATLDSGAVANAGPDVTVCSNYDLQLGTPALPGQIYWWEPNIFISDSTVAMPDFTYPNDSLSTASFEYMVNVVAGQCTTFDYVNVAVNPSLSAVAEAVDTTICIGDSTDLTAIGNLIGGYTYLWNTGDTTQSINVKPTTTTTYSVVTFNEGCSSDPAYVTVNVQQGPSATVSGDVEVCPGGGTILTANGGANYVWLPMTFLGQSMALSSLQEDTTVFVVAIDAENCPGPPIPVSVSLLEAPEPDFGADPVCEGLNTTFNDSSTIKDGNVVAWRWEFGDGKPGAFTQNPTHVYDLPGQYFVKQVVTSDLGCVDSLVRLVTVDPTPTADFAFTNVCEGLPNLMNNTSTIEPGGFINQFEWSFGDGTGDNTNSQNTQHTYNAYGYYNVTLTVTTPQGCADDYTQTVFVHPNPVSDFEVVDACQDSVVFASTGSAVGGELDYISNYAWDFGDPLSGQNNFALTPQAGHPYVSAGLYQITHTVTTANGCSDQIQREVTVFATPTADFTYDNTCENEFTQFSTLSNSNDATVLDEFTWDFGDGNVSAGEQVENMFHPTGPGTYSVRLAIGTNEGCRDTMIKQVIINPEPLPNFGWEPVCLYDSMLFGDMTQVASGSIARWEYDFGDGIGTSSLPSPAYAFLSPGLYNVELTAITDSGCVNVFTTEVETWKLPEIIEVIQDSTCFGNTATLAAIPDEDVSITWYYNFDDVSPFHRGYTYTTPPLPYPVTYYLMARDANGCMNERVPITANVYENEDLSIVVDTNFVDLPLAVVDFDIATTVPIASYEWSFGDGNSSILSQPSHQYTYPGRFETKVKVTDVNGCETLLSQFIEVRRTVGVWAPTAFSPNNDDYNDEYYISTANLDITTFELQIFNRWGQMVFQTNDPTFRWNGTSMEGGALQEGVYLCRMKGTYFDGEVFEEANTITLIR